MLLFAVVIGKCLGKFAVAVAKDRGPLTVSNDNKIRRDFILVAKCRWSLIPGLVRTSLTVYLRSTTLMSYLLLP